MLNYILLQVKTNCIFLYSVSRLLGLDQFGHIKQLVTLTDETQGKSHFGTPPFSSKGTNGTPGSTATVALTTMPFTTTDHISKPDNINCDY